MSEPADTQVATEQELVRVVFLPLGYKDGQPASGDRPPETPLHELEVPQGTRLLDVIWQAGLPIDAPCRGRGRCGRCKVKVEGERASLSPASASEKRTLGEEALSEGWRLACQARVVGSIAVRVPATVARLSILTSGVEREVKCDPGVSRLRLQLDPPDLEDTAGDWERLERAAGTPLKPGHLSVLRAVPVALRSDEFSVVVDIGRRQSEEEPYVLAVHSPAEVKGAGGPYGIAFDLGTTTVAGGLVDLTDGRELAVASTQNRQSTFGADVVSRIEHSKADKGLRQLQREAVESLNEVSRQLMRQAGVRREDVVWCTVVGNTTMLHLLTGVPPAYLAETPYVPAFQRGLVVSAAQLDLDVAPGAFVEVLPSVAGFVGADTVGVMLAAEMDRVNAPVLAIDIGTNGEIALAVPGKIVTCSTAAGPAFEGAEITCGTRACPGAIDRVWLEDGRIKVHTIEKQSPVGICGSGLVDAVAVMLHAGVLDATGRLLAREELSQVAPAVAERLVQREGEAAFVLTWADAGKSAGKGRHGASGGGGEVYLTQGDVRRLQLAKGAIYAGCQVLLRQLELEESELDAVLLAGAFGNYVGRESALAIGLLPQVPIERVHSVGNTARIGARIALTSQEEAKRAVRLAGETRYVELSARADFQQAFMEAMYFPQQRPGD